MFQLLIFSVVMSFSWFCGFHSKNIFKAFTLSFVGWYIFFLFFLFVIRSFAIISDAFEIFYLYLTCLKFNWIIHHSLLDYLCSPFYHCLKPNSWNRTWSFLFICFTFCFAFSSFSWKIFLFKCLWSLKPDPFSTT